MEYPYFMTCTVVGWLSVFTRPEAVEIVLDSLRFLQRERELKLFGYVIMENHLHMVASAPELSKVIKDFKSFTARQLIDLLEARSAETILRQLRTQKLPHKRESTYQFWQEGSHTQQIQNEEMMRQKLDYIHYNPVKRGYVDEPEHWRYSSARNYAGRNGLIEVITDWR
jgi:REP element-mobilizing transposase RayT